MADKKALIVGNWKMHLSIGAAEVLMDRLDNKVKSFKNVETVICPSHVALAPLADSMNTEKFKLGAQNMHYKDEGALTGEISPVMIKDLVDYVILGHSERRIHFHEKDDFIAHKMAAAVRNDITPILCMGENLIERQEGETGIVIHDQIMTGLTMLTSEDVEGIAIAYEPIWAIGTGDFAKPAQVKKAVDTIRQNVRELYGAKTGEKVRVLYGGSVKPDLAAGYLEIDGVDGLLIGGASLNYEEFSAIIHTAHNK